MTTAWDTCKHLYLHSPPGRSPESSQTETDQAVVATQMAMRFEAALLLVYQEVHVILRDEEPETRPKVAAMPLRR